MLLLFVCLPRLMRRQLLLLPLHQAQQLLSLHQAQQLLPLLLQLRLRLPPPPLLCLKLRPQAHHLLLQCPQR